MEVDNIANFFSIMAIICGISLRGPQVYKIYTTNPLSVNELSTDTMILSIVMNSCILFYMIRNTEKMDQYGHQDWIKELQENQKRFETQLKDLNEGSDLPDDTTDTMKNYG